MGEKANRIHEAQEWRRGKVLEYTSQGYTQREIASKLQVANSTIAEDQIYLRNKAKDNLENYIHEKLPSEYERVLTGINLINKESWEIAHNTDDNREKISALSLAKECYSMTLDLATNASLIDHAVRFVEKYKSKNNLDDDEQQREEAATTTDDVF